MRPNLILTGLLVGVLGVALASHAPAQTVPDNTYTANLPVTVDRNTPHQKVTVATPVTNPDGSLIGSGGSGGGAVTIADGANVTQGSKADAATCGINNTLIACARQLHNDLIAATPAGTNAIGSITNTSFGALLNGAAPSVINPIWIANAEAPDTTGTFTNGTQTTSITNSSADGYAAGLLSINGTYATASGVFEVSDDGGATYYPVICARSDGTASETGYTTLTNTNRQWSCPVGGNDTLRIRSTAVATGTVNARVGISAPPPSSNTVAGTLTTQNQVYTGSIFTNMLGDASGNTKIVGTETAGSAVTGGGVRMMGSDGASARDMALTTGGSVVTAGSLISGSGTSTTGNLIMGFDGTNDRALTTDTVGSLKTDVYTNSINAADGATNSIAGLGQPAAQANALRLGVSNFVYNNSTWDRQYELGATGTAATGVTAVGPIGQFNTTAPTLTNGQYGGIQLTSRGYGITAIGAGNGTSLVTVSNGSADAVSATTGVLDVANFDYVFNGTTWDRHYSGAGAATAGGGLGAAAVEENGRTYTHISTATTTTIKSGKGNMHEMCINTTAALATITAYDSTTGSGTVIGVITNPTTLLQMGPLCAWHDIAFTTGLTIVTTGTQDITFVTR